MAYTTYLTLLVPAVITFIVTVIAVLFARGYMRESGIVVTDRNKRNRPIIPTSGGIAVAFGFAFGILTYIFGASFKLYSAHADLNFLFATVLSVILISLVGFVDDINIKRTAVKTTGMMDTRKGLKQWQKPLFSLVGAIPLMAINAGTSMVNVPFLGIVNFGIFYPLLILPLAIIFASNAINLLGGFDGIASGTALVLSIGLLIYAVGFDSTNPSAYIGALISASLSASILALLLFDRYPASILSGDSFTYYVGAALVATMVLGNMESFGVIISIPFIIEFLLHARGKFKTTDLGKLKTNGTFESPYGKRIYSWTHFIMNLKPCKEWEVSLYMWIIEALFVALGLGLKAYGLL